MRWALGLALCAMASIALAEPQTWRGAAQGQDGKTAKMVLRLRSIATIENLVGCCYSIGATVCSDTPCVTSSECTDEAAPLCSGMAAGYASDTSRYRLSRRLSRGLGTRGTVTFLVDSATGLGSGNLFRYCDEIPTFLCDSYCEFTVVGDDGQLSVGAKMDGTYSGCSPDGDSGTFHLERVR